MGQLVRGAPPLRQRGLELALLRHAVKPFYERGARGRSAWRSTRRARRDAALYDQAGMRVVLS